MLNTGIDAFCTLFQTVSDFVLFEVRFIYKKPNFTHVGSNVCHISQDYVQIDNYMCISLLSLAINVIDLYFEIIL